MNPKPKHYFSDENLVEGLKEQDPEIIKYLYDTIGPQVHNLVSRSGGKPEDARDIFQDGILAAYLNIQSGKYELSPLTRFSTYLIQICKYKWYDHRNSAYVRLHGGEVPEQSIEDRTRIMPEQEDRIKMIQKCYRLLGDQCKRILHLFYWEKWSIGKIGKELNMETNSAKNQKYRCMQRLRALVKDQNLEL